MAVIGAGAAGFSAAKHLLGRGVAVTVLEAGSTVGGLYFVGFFDVSGGANIRMMDAQANWVAALVTGEAGLPDRATMLARLEREQRKVARLYPGTPRYGLELDPRRYIRQIARELYRRPVGSSSMHGVPKERVGSHS